ncbi:MAG: bifunctional copper resistance protein CopD/cytochrome c oxidase assembly protein [Actinomycetota bacterium]|nr:bifunctional copper resistance protein CopD/cytochrome c oxidase assembly protein [Actinomycetota bacterium]
MTSKVDSTPLSPTGLPEPAVRSGRARWVAAAPATALLALVLSLLSAGGAPEPVPAGLPDPGPVTAWGLPLARLAFDLSAIAVVGALVTVLLLPRTGFLDAAGPALRAARRAAYAWGVSACALLLLTLSDLLGVPPGEVLAGERLPGASGYVWQLAQGRGLLLVLGCSAVLAAYSRWTRTRTGVAALLVVAVGGMLPVLFAGHSAAASNHDLATSSLVVHVLGASVWVGGLAGMLLLLRRAPHTLGEVLPRYSALALACFVAVALSGLLNAWVRTSGDLGLWASSGYGALLAAKIAALAGLGWFGWLHRRRTVSLLTDGRSGAFARLAVVEVALMAATVGVAVALARTPPPAGATADVPSHGAGHPTLGDEVEPFTFVRILTEWRPEAISLALVAILFACYLAGARRLHRRGESWPWPRTAAAATAAAVALVATSGGLATYSTATFSLQVAQFLVMLVVVPALVTLSAPVTLAASAVRPGEAGPERPGLPAVLRSPAAAWLLDPLNTLILVTVLVFGLYATPLLEASLRSAPLHLSVNIATLAAGFLLWSAVLGRDPLVPARPRAYRLWVLAGFLVLLGGIAARIHGSEVLLAGQWFTDLDWTWVEEPQDQRLGAVLMAGVVVALGPLLAVVTGLPRADVADAPETAAAPRA